MKNLRKDNKGFSLVELIVVVLIMAIIAVALAPQILKWVNNSRISSDHNTMQQVVSNFQTALTNETAFSEAKTAFADAGTDVMEIKNGGYSWKVSSGIDTLKAKFEEYSGGSSTTDFKTKVNGKTITITINKQGKVTGAYDGDSSIDN